MRKPVSILTIPWKLHTEVRRGASREMTLNASVTVSYAKTKCVSSTERKENMFEKHYLQDHSEIWQN